MIILIILNLKQEEVLTNNKKGNGSESSFRKTLAAFLQIELVSRQVFSVKVYEFYKRW